MRFLDYINDLERDKRERKGEMNMTSEKKSIKHIGTYNKVKTILTWSSIKHLMQKVSFKDKKIELMDVIAVKPLKLLVHVLWKITRNIQSIQTGT